MNKHIDKILISQGWYFTYDSQTGYIGLEHPKGAKQYVCEMKHPYYNDELGRIITDFLNQEDEELWDNLIKVCRYRDRSYSDDTTHVCNKLERDHLGPIILCSVKNCPILMEVIP